MKTETKKAQGKFSSLREHFNTAALVGAAYAADALVCLQNMTADDLLGTYPIIIGIFLALRIPALREIAMLSTKLLTRATILRGVTDAPECIQSATDEFTKKSGMKNRIKAHVYQKGWKDNAFCLGNDIYIGQGLIDKLTPEQLDFVIAHEVSHTKTNDLSELSLFVPTYLTAIIYGVQSLYDPAVFVGGHTGPLWSAAAVTTGAAYYLLQRCLKNINSRQAEYRADRNAVKLTEDFEAAANALLNLHPPSRRIESKKGALSFIFGKTHPGLSDRIRQFGYELEGSGLSARVKKIEKPQNPSL